MVAASSLVPVPKWVSNTTALQAKLRMKGCAWEPLTSDIDAKGVNPTARVKSLLQTAHMALGESFSCDVSQDVHRTPWAKDSVHTITSSTDLYWSTSPRGGRAVLSREHFSLLGYPSHVVQRAKGFSPGMCKDLAGECMAPPVIGFVVMCLLAGTTLPCVADAVSV